MPQSIYIKDYNTTVTIPDGSNMEQVRAALAKQFPPKDLNSQPDFGQQMGRKITGMGAPGVVQNPPAEWRQTGAKIANTLPALGRATGSAAGIAGLFDPTTGGPLIAGLKVPLAGAAGEIAGTGLQHLLTKVVLPESGSGVATPNELAQAGISGAIGSMLDAMLMRFGVNLSGIRPLESMEPLINPETALSAKIRDWATKNALKPSLKNYDEAMNVVKNVGKQKLDIAGATAPGQVQNKIRNLSGSVDEIIAESGAPKPLPSGFVGPPSPGTTINKNKALEPFYQLKNRFAGGDMPEYLQKVNDYIKNFNQLHPENELTPAAAQELKQFIYQTIDKPGMWEGFTYNPSSEARKTLSSSLASKLEEAAGPKGKKLHQLNQELGDLIEMRPYVQEGAEKAQEAGLYKSLTNRALQKLSHMAERSNAALRKRPSIPSEETTRYVGSPYPQLEEMMKMEFNPPSMSGGALQSPETLIKNQGLEFIGTTPELKLPKAMQGKGGMYWFNDPKTGSTLAMFETEITPEGLSQHVTQSQKGNWSK